jgi:hypothetical protein
VRPLSFGLGVVAGITGEPQVVSRFHRTRRVADLKFGHYI